MATNASVDDGVVACSTCQYWYPIEDGLLDLLTGSLAYPNDRAIFWQRHQCRLEALGLQPDWRDSGSRDATLQIKQQEHFDWYAKNDIQSYDSYEAQPFWVAVD